MQAGVSKLLATICLLVWAAKCPSQELFWGNDQEGFQLGLYIEKTSVQTGEPIVATVVARNTSDVARRLPILLFPNTPYHFIVTRDRAEIVRLPENPKLGKFVNESIGPNVSVTNQVRLDSQFDLTKPGTYVVTALRSIPPASVSDREYPPITDMFNLSSGNAIIRIVENTNIVASNGSPTSAQSPIPNSTTENPASRSGRPSAKPRHFAVPGNKAAASGSSTSVSKASPLAEASPLVNTGGVTRSQKIAMGIIAALLAMLLAILWRASRRGRASKA